MEEKETFGQKVKGHFKKHKGKYIAGGVITVTGVTCFYIGRKSVKGYKIIPTINNVVSPVFNNNNINTNVNMGGHQRKLVKRLSDGRIWETVGEAAEAADVSYSTMSRHLNGHSNDIKGDIYEIIGIGTN